MTMLLSSLLGLMLFFLAAMDNPFCGKFSVRSEAFQLVYDSLMKPEDLSVFLIPPAV